MRRCAVVQTSGEVTISAYTADSFTGDLTPAGADILAGISPQGIVVAALPE